MTDLDPEALVAGAYDCRAFTLAPRAKSMLVGGKVARIHQDTEKRLVLPNGAVVRVSVDASNHATQIEENDRLHAVARPDSVILQLRKEHR
jgi:hypothetical protein